VAWTDLLPPVFLLGWAAYNWVCYKYPERVPNPFGLGAHRLDASEDEGMTAKEEWTCPRCLTTFSAGLGEPPLCGSCEDEALLTGNPDHPNPQLWANRLDPEERDQFKIKPVYLTVNERQMVARALAEYLDKAGQIRGCPEAETWVRAAWAMLVDMDERLDEAEEPEPIDHEAWRKDVQDRTGVDPVTGTEVE
jgi:hypothetical protein